MNNRWREKGYTVIGMVCVMLLCLFVGARLEQNMRQQDENLQTVTEIAVVNMDTGTVRNGKKLNYAAGLVQFPDTNFTYTGLEAAREGVANGRFAAYIMIPEGFSECVVSIEGEPENIKIQYAVGEALREDIYNRIVSNIHDFEIMLNTNISYMYISAILAEFHEGQDAAGTIMENDKEEMDLILGIDAQELLAELEIADTEYPENNLEYMDLSEEQRKNSEYLDKISDYQNESLEKAQTEFQKVKEEDTALQSSFAAISKTLEGIEITKDEEGNPVYEEGVKEIEQMIAEYKEKFLEERKAVMQQAGWYLNENGEETVSGNEAVYAKMEQSLENYAAEYNQKLETAIKEIDACIANLKIETVSGNEAEPDETVSGNGTEPGKAAANGTVSGNSPAPGETVSGNGSDSGNRTIAGLEELKKAVADIPEFTYDSKALTEGILTEWQWNIVNAAKEMTEPDTQEWQRVFQEGVIDKVLEEAEKEDAVLKEQRKAAAAEMNKYETALGEFNPFQYMEEDKLRSYIAELNENIFDMEEEINESTLEKEEYVSALYGAVLENETMWRGNMDEAYAATSGNVQEMVSGLQQNRTNMNETNTDLLLEFSKQLPYTRLGKVEYTRMYDFVTHPLQTSDLSSTKAKILHNRDYEPFIFGSLGVFILWLAAGGIYHIYRTVKEEKAQDK